MIGVSNLNQEQYVQSYYVSNHGPVGKMGWMGRGGGGGGGQCGDIDFVYHGPQIIYPYLFLFLKVSFCILGPDLARL